MQGNEENFQALGNVESLRRALDTLHDASTARAGKVLEAAREQAAGGGESDLRRLKRQFSSLKNTYMLYDTKEHFIDGLLDDLPDGSEERKLQDLEQHVRVQGAEVKALKQQNGKVQEEIAELVSRICADVQALQEEHAAALEVLSSLAADLRQGKEAAAAEEALPLLEQGPGEDECRALLAAAGDTARQLETSIAGDEAEAAELQAAVQSEEEAVQTLRAQEEQLRADEAAAAAGEGQDRQQRERGAEAAARMRAALEWLGEATALVRSLSGVSIVEVHEDGLCLALATHAEVPGAVGWTGAEVRSWRHELRVALQPGSAAVRSAELAPADLDLADIVAAAQRHPRPLGFVVREAHARLAAHLAVPVAGPEEAAAPVSAPQ